MQEFNWKLGRPVEKNFVSPAVERVISEAEAKIQNKELYKLFSRAFPNTLDTTVKYTINPEAVSYTHLTLPTNREV